MASFKILVFIICIVFIAFFSPISLGAITKQSVVENGMSTILVNSKSTFMVIKFMVFFSPFHYRLSYGFDGKTIGLEDKITHEIWILKPTYV